jgi:hypothetical protein
MAPRASERVSVMWSASYHLTEETSRFILSVGNRVLGGFSKKERWARSVRPRLRQRPYAVAFHADDGEKPPSSKDSTPCAPISR